MAVSPRTMETSVLSGLVLFGVVAIVLGVVNLKRFIGPQIATRAGDVRALAEDDAEERAALAALDTDKDGLSDLDELERTHTSPYLADSDSDGRTDKDEVDAGADPNCPTGEDCSIAIRAETSPQPMVPAGDAGAASADPLAALAAPEAAAAGVPDVRAVLSELPQSPEDIRTALAQAGIPRAQLESMDDETLLKLWQEALATLEQSTQANAAPRSP